MSLDLANKIGGIAEEQGHHPDLLVRWGELGIEVWTHAIDGLSEADFILAAKIDRLT
jgi:4a-hydroxytetrahydrobiopterin dehydratase